MFSVCSLRVGGGRRGGGRKDDGGLCILCSVSSFLGLSSLEEARRRKKNFYRLLSNLRGAEELSLDRSIVAVSFTWVCGSRHHNKYLPPSTFPIADVRLQQIKHTAIHAHRLVGKLSTSTHWVATEGRSSPNPSPSTTHHRIGSSFYILCQPRMTIESSGRRAAIATAPTKARTWIILYSQLGFWESGRWKICYKWKCLTNLKAPRDTKFTTLHTDYTTPNFLAIHPLPMARTSTHPPTTAFLGWEILLDLCEFFDPCHLKCTTVQMVPSSCTWTGTETPECMSSGYNWIQATYNGKVAGIEVHLFTYSVDRNCRQLCRAQESTAIARLNWNSKSDNGNYWGKEGEEGEEVKKKIQRFPRKVYVESPGEWLNFIWLSTYSFKRNLQYKPLAIFQSEFSRGNKSSRKSAREPNSRTRSFPLAAFCAAPCRGGGGWRWFGSDCFWVE